MVLNGNQNLSTRFWSFIFQDNINLTIEKSQQTQHLMNRLSVKSGFSVGDPRLKTDADEIPVTPSVELKE